MNLEFKSKKTIAASPEIVWMVVSDPQQWPAFVDRIQELEHREGELHGRITWREKDFRFRGRITERVENQRLVADFQVTQSDRKDRMRIAFELKPKGDDCRVSESVALDIEVNPLLGMLARGLSRFGEPQELTNLDRLAELIEDPS
jgi:uncharacterized protein YndB with AHSA1/START domain